jgi:hypothetical protein
MRQMKRISPENMKIYYRNKTVAICDSPGQNRASMVYAPNSKISSEPVSKFPEKRKIVVDSPGQGLQKSPDIHLGSIGVFAKNIET